MNVQGTIYKVGEVQKISEKFQKREVVIRTGGDYPQLIGCQLTQDKCILLDESNVGETGDLILLPIDPDLSARTLRHRLYELTGQRPGIVISDTFGRPWRLGQVNVAIGLAGVPALSDLSDSQDAWGRSLQVTQPAIADELAAASGLLMAKSAKTPVILFRGMAWESGNASIEDMIRAPQEDLF